ncbi:inner dynein arm I1 intermediate chain IC140 [Haematococcus lacustris]|uniref:Inner dynein arm I1 intermediate chain IC140 n=1 Tax=Haematococcus lacustris TaxID=44745 RepID=A0A699ZG09_HAELA|nr:inner dynein arm I1 intermediate chain IC140 [Haematococcus lacustris]
MRAASNRQDMGEGGDDASIAVVKAKYFSTIEFSHHHVVMDLQWLPGVDITSRGRVSRSPEGGRECNFVATTAGDGKVNIWDIRVDRLLKKGRKAEDLLDLVWKPLHSAL